MSGERIVLIDDDVNIGKLLQAYLASEGMEVQTYLDVISALEPLAEDGADVILLDVMLPGISGLDALPMIKKTTDAPIILLTARDMLEDKIKGFEAGADDYIVKPFEPKEVLMRIRARARTGRVGNGVEAAGVSVDMDRYRVMVDGRVIEGLKPREVQLLHFFVSNPGRVFNRDQLLNNVWGPDAFVDTRTVDAHIKHIRRALGSHGDAIKTVWGVGYKLEIDE